VGGGEWVRGSAVRKIYCTVLTAVNFSYHSVPTERLNSTDTVARSQQAFTATTSKKHGHLGTFHGHQIFLSQPHSQPYFWFHFLPHFCTQILLFRYWFFAVRDEIGHGSVKCSIVCRAQVQKNFNYSASKV
jgi:hypothetical protein